MTPKHYKDQKLVGCFLKIRHFIDIIPCMGNLAYFARPNVKIDQNGRLIFSTGVYSVQATVLLEYIDLLYFSLIQEF